MIKKIYNLKFVIRNLQGGMSYVELIVVLSIFATMSAIVIYNYGEFQAKVDIKNLASDISLKIVEAQKSSLDGKLPPSPFTSLGKPSFGVYLDPGEDKSFIYFVDIDGEDGYEKEDDEIVDTFLITKNNSIEDIYVCSNIACDSLPSPVTDPFSISFRRPDSKANFIGITVNNSEYVKIRVKSPKAAKADIDVYPSGRIQVN